MARTPKGIILSGGPASVYASDSYHPDSTIFDLGLPILGICYGMQLIAQHFGGSVIPATSHEYGKAKLDIIVENEIFKDTQNGQIVWMSHGDRVESIPSGFEKLQLVKIHLMLLLLIQIEISMLFNFILKFITQNVEANFLKILQNIFVDVKALGIWVLLQKNK